MKNAILSQVSSQFTSHGSCNEALFDIPLQISGDMNSSSLFMDVDFSYHSQFTSGSSINSKRKLSASPQRTHDDMFNPTWDNIFVQQSKNSATQSTRKRSAQALDEHTTQVMSFRGFGFSATNEERQMRFQEQLPKIQKQKVPTMKRSQRLTDKITALQKLVSPYGKTDTASVLLEAYISIKALQHQIKVHYTNFVENSFRMLSMDSQLNMKEGGRKRSELQSMGLCLVPLSISEELREQYSPNVYSSVSLNTSNL